MQLKFSELKKKDVLNVETGTNLGKIIDLVIDGTSGKILKIITSGKKLCLLPCDGVELDYCKITKIGEDFILVSTRTKKCDAPIPPPCPPLAGDCLPCSAPLTNNDFDEE